MKRERKKEWKEGRKQGRKEARKEGKEGRKPESYHVTMFNYQFTGNSKV